MYKRLLKLLSAALVLLMAFSFQKDPVEIMKSETLRQAAERRSLFYIGTIYNNNVAVNSGDRVTYKKVLGSEFNYLQCEWDMSMGAIWTGRHEYNFKWCDNAADFAVANHMKLRGAHLIWHGELPQWNLAALSNAEFELAVNEYIDTVITHFKTKYPGLITEWNVVNEVLDHDGIVHAGETRFRPSVFLEKMGPDFVQKAFRWAHHADPNAKLYICDYDFLGNESDNSGKADLLYNLVTELLKQKVPIHGVAEQCHLDIDEKMGSQDMNYYSTTMDRFGNLGLDFQITECTIALKSGKEDLETKLRKQASILRDIVNICKTKGYFTGFSFWGFVDSHTYLDAKEYPVLFDKNYNPKPSYFAVYNSLIGR